MPTPWTPAARIAAHTGVFNALAAGASPPKFDIYDAGNVLLVSLPLAGTGAAAGSVSGTTGAITFAPGAAQTAVASGTASYARLVAADGTTLFADPLPVAQGTAPVAGSVVITTTAILTGGLVQLLSADVGV